MAFPIQAAAAGLGILGKIGTSIFQGAKANKLERDNPFVKEEMAPELAENLASAKLNANNGLAAPAYNKAVQDIGRGTSTYLRAFGRTGRAGSLLSAIRGQNDALLNLNVADEAAIERNRNTLRSENRIMAGEKARLYNVNVRQPYEKVQARISNLRGASNANLGGSFSDATQLGAMLLPQGGSASGVGQLSPAPYNPFQPINGTYQRGVLG